MEEPIVNFEEQQNLTDKEIFTKIWTSPKQVFKFINDTHYDKYVRVLLMLAGISNAFGRASWRNLGDRMSIWAIVIYCIVLGALLGWILLYIYAALINWTGKWLKAQGETKSILRMLSYASLPSIISLVFLVPQIAIYGNEIFKSDGDTMSAGWLANSIVYVSMLLKFILEIWTIMFYVVGISEVQKLSIGKSILNLLLAVVVILIPLMAYIIIYRGIN